MMELKPVTTTPSSVRSPLRQQRPDARSRVASMEGRRLARRLVGLPREETSRLTKIFVGAFLEELTRKGGLRSADVLEIAGIPLDIAIRLERGES